MTDPLDVPDPAAGPEQARTLRRLLTRHAVDTRPLAIAPYRRLLVGQGTSFIGSMLTQVAVPVQIYALTRSSLYVGFVGLAGLLPIVVFGLYGGAIADAVDRRRLYLWASIGSWVVTLALLVQTLLDVRNVGLILALVVVQSAMFAIASSARGAIIPRIVDADLVPAANTLNFTVSNLGQVVGPLIAGLLVGLHNGFAYAYAIDALLFTAALYSALRLPDIPPDGSVARPNLRVVADGLRFIATRPVLLMSFLVDIAAMVLAMPRSLFPALADLRFHGNVGPLYAALAIGAVVAGLTSGWIGRVRRQGRALVIAIVGWGVAIAVSGLAHQLWLVVVLLAVAGAADFVSAVYRQTILQTYAPDEMRGRMQGVFIAVVAGGPRLGDVRAGATASVATPEFSWVAGGLTCIVVVLVAGYLVRSFWCYDSGVVEPVETAAVPDG
ncbi:MAG: putative arabinose efflux permease, family [Pseudonocardiales bacterium]|nr:putative arabinose efflux permease, family [Pseudonocardiales bacterium]